jgi:hypothetical protein
LEEQIANPPRLKRHKTAWYGAIVEYQDSAGVCRVCGAPAPIYSYPRKDGLRVCDDASCRAEAKRRDNAAKQREYNARVRKKQDQVEQNEELV